MWLCRDERRLLAGYYVKFAGVSAKKVYHTIDLIPLLKFYGQIRRIYEYGQTNPTDKTTTSIKSIKRDIKSCIKGMNRINTANELLKERGMIKVTPHVSESNVIVVELTVQGYDLGKKYASLFESSGLLYQEYRKHWLWLIFAYIAGALSSKGVIELILDNLKNTR
jgi:hypothetical protein